MKKLIILFLGVFACFSSYAQDPQLLENDWNLQKVIIDEEEYFPPLPNAEIQSILTIYGTDGFLTSMCNDLSGPVSYTNQDFVFTEALTITLGSCSLYVNNEFEQLYFGVYLNNESYPFEYSITTSGNSTLLLSIIGQNGDQAIYNNMFFANPEFNASDFNVFPNPATNKIVIDNSSQNSINKIMVYDTLGRKILQEWNPVSQLDISKLSSGLLFVKIETDKGIITKKIIKE